MYIHDKICEKCVSFAISKLHSLIFQLLKAQKSHQVMTKQRGRRENDIPFNFFHVAFFNTCYKLDKALRKLTTINIG